MKKIMFVCHGNICRSPMAELIMRDLLASAGLSDKFSVSSSATSYEEIGNPVYPPARRELLRHGIDPAGKRAVKLEKSDYDKYDLFVGMDSANIRNMNRIFVADPESKVKKLLEFASDSSDVADPWYTGDFVKTYDDCLRGCKALLKFLTEK